MKTLVQFSRSAHSRVVVLGVLLFGVALSGANCQSGGGNENGDNVNVNLNGSSGSAPTIEILLQTDQNIPSDQSSFTILYNVRNVDISQEGHGVIAFYNATPEVGTNGEVSGIFSTTLPGGQSQAFSFDVDQVLADSGRGTYYVGMRAFNGSGTTTQFATKSDGTLATVKINEVPIPTITFPVSDRNVLVGSSVNVTFDCNDPEGEASWMLFHKYNSPVVGNETFPLTGCGNRADVIACCDVAVDPIEVCSSQKDATFQTQSLPEGEYQLGLYCIDDAGTQKTAVGKTLTLTNEPILADIIVTEPAQNLQISPNAAPPDNQFAVEFEVSGEPAVSDLVILFVDTNSQFGEFDDSETIIATKDTSETFANIPASLLVDSPQGGFYIGAFVGSGDEGNVDYAPGRVTVIGAGSLAITEPARGEDPSEVAVSVKPGTDVRIQWQTNLTAGLGLVDVVLYDANEDGSKGSELFEIATDLSTTTRSATLDTISLPSGLYVVEVTLNPTDSNGNPTGDATSKLSGLIRVTTLPDIFWVGRIENPAAFGHFDGNVFEGVNFEDNAGNSMLGVGNIDNVSGDDILIAAQFAKPYFTNPGGIGAGQAYLIYGDALTPNARYSLNNVGTSVFSGLQFAGIAFDQSPEDIIPDDELTCLSEDVDGDGFLDLFNEIDILGTGVIVPLHDRDLDGNLDVAEDGWVGPDADCDGVVDDPTARVFDEQYVNGALDFTSQFFGDGGLTPYFSEDRDFDNSLDVAGDATLGLFRLALLPDIDGDGRPELSFSFPFTDSLRADFREDPPLNRTEPVEFGELTQENQFERGGIVIVPSGDEATIEDPARLGRGGDRVVQLDFVGQDFSSIPSDLPAPSTGGLGVVPPIGSAPEGRPRNGHDAYPFVADFLDTSESGADCDPEQEVYVRFANSISSYHMARAHFIVRSTNSGGETEQDTESVEIFAGQAIDVCLGDCSDNGRVDVTLTRVEFYEPDDNSTLTRTIFPSGVTVSDLPCNSSGQYVVFGVSGLIPQEAEAYVACENQTDCLNQNIRVDSENVCVEGSDNCDETIVGPFYGFTYQYVDLDMESPTHPLAYVETLANPTERQNEYFELTSACGGICGRMMMETNSIRFGSAPAFDVLSTGYYPGIAQPPIGARILGQRFGDYFGYSVSRTPESDGPIQFVYTGAPLRPNDPVEPLYSAGVVYQFRMHKFWDSSNGLAGINLDDTPRPHQYIMKEVGSSRPIGETLHGPNRSSMSEAIVYTGADAGDGLGAAVVGIRDFNGDGRSDIFMGAPGADGPNNSIEDSGSVYVVYRLPVSIEASVSLSKLELSPNDANRLNGLSIYGDAGDAMGSKLAGNCDLNGDGIGELIIGNPRHDTGAGEDAGEVIVIWGGPNLTSPEGGYSIQQVVSAGRAVRIQGPATSSGDQVGFAVACDGDFNGDGKDDLVFSAPYATPMYDSDGDDVLDTEGLDLNRDGIDDGFFGSPPIATEAGMVYVITNAEDLVGNVSLDEFGARLQGFAFAGVRTGDQLGGGCEGKKGLCSEGIAYAGDVNGDGRSDLMISSILADPDTGLGVSKTNAGEVYLIYGFNETTAENILNPD